MTDTYPLYARDTNLTYTARGVLHTLTADTYTDNGATILELASEADDSISQLSDALAELVAAGYATREAHRSVWRATEKARITGLRAQT